jgi:hypothetical protein
MLPYDRELSRRATAGRHWGYIDRTWKFVIEPQFGDAWLFSEGVALINLDGKWGLIDKTGKILFQTNFFLMKEFQSGLAEVCDSEYSPSTKFGHVDRAGKLIWQPSR